MKRVFLAIVGLIYISLAAWCSLLPDTTARSVGFELTRGSGQSEYLVVYGGLQAAIGILFMWPAFQNRDLDKAVRACLIIHLSLVIFRTISFLTFDEIGSTTYYLAGAEWCLLLSTAAVMIFAGKQTQPQQDQADKMEPT